MQKTRQALDQPIHLYKYQDDPSMKDDLPPVKFWKLFRFADKLDYVLLTLGFICAIGNGVSLIFYANPFGQLTQAFAPNADKNMIVEETKKAVFGFLINAAIVFINSWISQACWSISSERQTIKCRKQYFRALFRHEPAWYDHKRSTQVAQKMYIQTNHLQQSIGNKIATFIMTSSLVLSGIIISMTRGWRMAIVLISFIPVMFVSGIFSNKITTRADKATNSVVERMNGSALEVIENIRTVKMLNSQEYEIDRYNIYLEKLSAKGLYFGCLKSVVWAIFFFCIIMNYTLGFWYGSLLVSRETYNDNTGATFAVSDVIVIFFTIYTSNLSLGQIPDCLALFELGCLSGAKIFSIIDRKPLIESGDRFMPLINDITFKDVYFRFDAPLFENFNIKIKRGKTAFVGESGSGKSTIVNMLLRFYDPLSGGIKINGNTDYKELDLLALRQSIGYVGQEPVLLGKTLRQALMAEEKTDDEIIEALKNAEAYSFVKQIGINTEFGQLSGGQKQRIAIARALLKKPQILILDEATSALDRTNEMEIQKTIDKLNVPFTIIIAHKIETIEKADEIYVLNRGKVIEAGDYNSLFQQRGKFYELATKQIALNKQDVVVQQKQQQTTKPKQVTTDEKLSSDELNVSKQELVRKFSWKYVFRLFGFNGSRNILLVIGVLCSMAVGCIFPVFSRFLSIMIVTLSGIKYAEDDAKKAEYVSIAMQQSLYLLIISLSALVAVSIRGTILNVVRQKLGLELKKTVYTKLLSMNVTYFDRTGTGICSAVLNNDCNVINRIGSQLVSDIFQNLATLVCGLTIAFVACWQMTLIALAVLPVLLLAGKLQLSLNEGFSSETDKAYKKCHQIVVESLLNYKTILSFNHQGNMIQKYDDLLEEPMKIAIKKGNAVGISFGIAQAVISCIFALIFYIGALLIRDHNIGVLSIYTSIYAIMFTAVQAGGQLGFIPNIVEMKMFCTNVFQILDNQQDVQHNPIGGSKSPIEGNIEFKNVVFEYPLRPGKVYQGLNLEINAGEKVALVGPSGCGKSTLLQLLLKLYNIEDGEILLEGRNIDDYDIGHIRNSMSVVSQEPVLFNRSIYENIKYNQTEATYDDVVIAARMANCFDFIEQGNFGVKNYTNELEIEQQQQDLIKDAEIEGFRRKAGPKGGFLSGGQKQRIAIARALIRKPKIIILDEATSALDSTNEQEVQTALDQIHGCTQIVIAHRLITIKDSDNIYAFNKGQVVERGTFEQLVKRKGYFYNLAQGKGDRS